MAKTQREMRVRSDRPTVDTQSALAMARAHAGSRTSQLLSPNRSQTVAPKLRVVTHQRRRVGFRISNKALVSYVVGFLALFAAIVTRAEMAATQLQLNSFNSELSAMKTAHQKLEVELSSLEAPNRIVAYAETRLGMIYPSEVGYLGAAPGTSPKQAATVPLTTQLLSSPNTLTAPSFEVGGAAPTTVSTASPVTVPKSAGTSASTGTSAQSVQPKSSATTTAAKPLSKTG